MNQIKRTKPTYKCGLSSFATLLDSASQAFEFFSILKLFFFDNVYCWAETINNGLVTQGHGIQNPIPLTQWLDCLFVVKSEQWAVLLIKNNATPFDYIPCFLFYHTFTLPCC